MPTPPSYPAPDRDLDVEDIIVGWVDGKMVSVSPGLLSTYVTTQIIPQMLSMLMTNVSELVDVNGAEPPAGPTFYLDGGSLKFNPGA